MQTTVTPVTKPMDCDALSAMLFFRTTRKPLSSDSRCRGRDPAQADENLYRYCENGPTDATTERDGSDQRLLAEVHKG